MIWQSKVPPRVAFFSWSASLGKILTTDNLRKRRVLVLDWCFMCKRCGESVDHLLLHCTIARELWSLVFCLFGIHWVMPHIVLELFEAWQGKFVWHCNIDVWRLVPHCLIWCIWHERNVRSFEGCERSLLEIKSFFLHTLFEWSVVCSHFSCSSFPTFLDRCTFGSWFVPPLYIPNVLGLVLFLLLIIFLRYLSKKLELPFISLKERLHPSSSFSHQSV